MDSKNIYCVLCGANKQNRDTRITSKLYLIGNDLYMDPGVSDRKEFVFLAPICHKCRKKYGTLTALGNNKEEYISNINKAIMKKYGPLVLYCV